MRRIMQLLLVLPAVVFLMPSNEAKADRTFLVAEEIIRVSISDSPNGLVWGRALPTTRPSVFQYTTALREIMDRGNGLNGGQEVRVTIGEVPGVETLRLGNHLPLLRGQVQPNGQNIFIVTIGFNFITPDALNFTIIGTDLEDPVRSEFFFPGETVVRGQVNVAVRFRAVTLNDAGVVIRVDTNPRLADFDRSIVQQLAYRSCVRSGEDQC